MEVGEFLFIPVTALGCGWFVRLKHFALSYSNIFVSDGVKYKVSNFCHPEYGSKFHENEPRLSKFPWIKQ